MSDARRSSPAALRNREPIARVLADWLPATGQVLEIASGTGEHALHFAGRFSALRWQPSDPDAEALASIAAWREEAGRPANLGEPLALDVAGDDWAGRVEQCCGPVAALVAINMVHISPWQATLGLFAGAARLLATGAPLILYGPYREEGVLLAPSNASFDDSLRARNPAWGLRERAAVEAVAAEAGFAAAGRVEMPAENIMLRFVRR